MPGMIVRVNGCHAPADHTWRDVIRPCDCHPPWLAARGRFRFDVALRDCLSSAHARASGHPELGPRLRGDERIEWTCAIARILGGAGYAVFPSPLNGAFLSPPHFLSAHIG